jgi:protein-tyrosine phosphatase
MPRLLFPNLESVTTDPGVGHDSDFIDVHCHCLPAVDDGPPSLPAALDLCRALVADGVRLAVATPHMLGRYDLPNHLRNVRAAHASLCDDIARSGLPLTIALAAEVRIDERIPTLLRRGQIPLIGHAKQHLLLELPDAVWVDPLPMIERLAADGIQVIIAHPERNRGVIDRPSRVRPWLEAGATLQLTAGSLCGDAGPLASATAWALLREGVVRYVASDAHDARRRPPRLQTVFAALRQGLGDAHARRLCSDNPRLLATGVQPPRGWRPAAAPLGSQL